VVVQVSKVGEVAEEAVLCLLLQMGVQLWLLVEMVVT